MYKFKDQFMAKVEMGAVVHFTSPIEGIGFSLTLKTATPKQLEVLYLLGHEWVEKTETKKATA